MDISTKYLKMCEKAYPDLGEPVMDIQFPTTYAIKAKADSGYFFETELHEMQLRRDEWFPVYSQDQLQEMVESSMMGKYIMCGSYLQDAIERDMPSFEELWLRIVMLKNYRKKWDDETETWEATQ